MPSIIQTCPEHMNSVLITGANRGIGLEFARQYSADGWRVYACARNPAKATALNELTAKSNGRLTMHALDVSNLAQIDALAAQLKDAPIDILLNNAGVYPDSRARFGNTDYDAWMEAFRINTMATLKMAEALVENVARSEKKRIVTITSKMGSMADNTSGGSYLYRSSKAAVHAVVKSLALDLKPRGIIAAVFNPGWVLTDMGGLGAAISLETSVAGMRQVFSELTAADSGYFLDYKGVEIPW
ncbi:MAG: SDR family oxidoreductase [Burkholderiales bacterium]